MFNYEDLSGEKQKKDFDLEETLEKILARYEIALNSDVTPFSDVVS